MEAGKACLGASSLPPHPPPTINMIKKKCYKEIISRCIHDRTELRGVESPPCRSRKAGGYEKEKRRHGIPRERKGRRQCVWTGSLSGDALLRTMDEAAQRGSRS